jgi:Flp pilus assembly protein protease CpaA
MSGRNGITTYGPAEEQEEIRAADARALTTCCAWVLAVGIGTLALLVVLTVWAVRWMGGGR